MTVSPDFGSFEQRYNSGASQVAWIRLIDDLETPVSAYLKIARDRAYSCLFESVEGGSWRGRYSIIALKPDLVWRCFGDRAEIADGAASIRSGNFVTDTRPALESLRDLVAATRIDMPSELPPPSAGLFGVIGYDMVRLVENLPNGPPDTLGLPDSIMMRPSIVAVFDAIAQEILLVTPVRPGAHTAAQAYDQARKRLEATIADLRSPLPAQVPTAEVEPPVFETKVSRADYATIVETCKSYIGAGDIFQVVPSHRFTAPFGQDSFALYRSLKRTNPSPFLFHLDLNGCELVGSSPEILVRLRDGKITIRPIAGTRRRGATPQEDLELEAELLADPKERAEHLMLLDLGRNDVGRVAQLGQQHRNAPPEAGTDPSETGPSGTGQSGMGHARRPRVRVTQSFTIERYSHVMHIVSNVEGDAPDGLDPVDVVMAALPAGTLSGAPKVRAMEIIDELEIEKRGLAYAGAAGYFGADGSVDTCIVLRTGLVKAGLLHVQAGGGIVADSDPDAEYDETLQKSAAIKGAAAEAWRFS